VCERERARERESERERERESERESTYEDIDPVRISGRLPSVMVHHNVSSEVHIS
jgi:hypothetical protein